MKIDKSLQQQWNEAWSLYDELESIAQASMDDYDKRRAHVPPVTREDLVVAAAVRYVAAWRKWQNITTPAEFLPAAQECKEALRALIREVEGGDPHGHA